MKKLLILTIFPIMLFSCSKTNKGQQEVSFATFCLSWKGEVSIKKANVAYAHTTIDKDSKDWNYITNGVEQDVPDEDKHKEDDNTYLFSESGSCVAEHEAITSFKPHFLNFERLVYLYSNAKSTKFYINPMRAVITVPAYTTNQEDGDPNVQVWTTLITFDYTFNKEMWISNYTTTSIQTVYYNGESGWLSYSETNNYTYTYF